MGLEDKILAILKRRGSDDADPPLHVPLSDVRRLDEEAFLVLETHFDWVARDGLLALWPRSNLYLCEQSVPSAASMVWHRAYRCRYCLARFDHWAFLELPLDVRFTFKMTRPGDRHAGSHRVYRTSARYADGP